ncbi:hypothetical protein NA29_08405 [Pandoraea sputorum]|nr:hypothetical protein NA29_08405 [Pandoraea sputorum]
MFVPATRNGFSIDRYERQAQTDACRSPITFLLAAVPAGICASDLFHFFESDHSIDSYLSLLPLCEAL